MFYVVFTFFFFKQKTAYEMRISDWSSDVCSSDLVEGFAGFGMDRDTAGPCLPTPHCKIDIERIQLDQPGATTDLLGSDQGSPRAGEGIEHNVAALGGVEQRIGHQAHGLWRRDRKSKLLNSSH